MTKLTSISILSLLAALAASASARADVPAAIAAPNEVAIATLHAQGAQIYECKRDTAGKLAWQFREPVATLMLDGKTIGRHYAGPSWELADGSALTAKVAGRAPADTSRDIPLLKLAVNTHDSKGRLTGVTTIQRINTQGGVLDGACETEGTMASIPYAADYVFLRKHL